MEKDRGDSKDPVSRIRDELIARGAAPGDPTGLVAPAPAEAESVGMPEFGRTLLPPPSAQPLRLRAEPVDQTSTVAVVEAEGVFAPIALAEAALAAASAAQQHGLALRVVRAPSGLGRLA